LEKAVVMTLHDKIRRRFGGRWRTDNLPWAFKRRTRVDLVKFWNDIGLRRGVEVGTREGRFAIAICQNMPDVDLTCVDPWMAYYGTPQEKSDRIYAKAMANLEPYKNIKIMKMTSMEALSHFENGSIDFVFIDGDHLFDYACTDIIFWSRKVRSGGFVAVHDYHNSHWNGVVKAVDAYTFCHNINPWYVISEREPTAFWVNP
jgi:predicted O-methyltransferase YrrM